MTSANPDKKIIAPNVKAKMDMIRVRIKKMAASLLFFSIPCVCSISSPRSHPLARR
jgi:hypothetical protein